MSSTASSPSPAPAIGCNSSRTRRLSSRCEGPTAPAAGPAADNLVLARGARARRARAGAATRAFSADQDFAGRGWPRRRFVRRRGGLARARPRQWNGQRRFPIVGSGARDRRGRPGLPRSARARDGGDRRSDRARARHGAAARRARQSPASPCRRRRFSRGSGWLAARRRAIRPAPDRERERRRRCGRAAPRSKRSAGERRSDRARDIGCARGARGRRRASVSRACRVRARPAFAIYEDRRSAARAAQAARRPSGRPGGCGRLIFASRPSRWI